MDAARRGGCDIYWAPLDELHPRHLALLDDVERDRRDAYLHAADRTRFALAAVMLRLVAAAHLGVPPSTVPIDRTCAHCGRPHGRPRLPGDDLHLSVTHSGGLAAVAASTAGPVGIDLEAIQPLDHVPLIAEVLAPQERDGVTSLDAFFTYWTRKESVLKATGAGLSIPMHELRVTPPSRPPRLLRYPGEPAVEARMIDLSPTDGYIGAATVLSGSPVAFRVRDALAALSQWLQASPAED